VYQDKTKKAIKESVSEFDSKSKMRQTDKRIKYVKMLKIS